MIRNLFKKIFNYIPYISSPLEEYERQQNVPIRPIRTLLHPTGPPPIKEVVKKPFDVNDHIIVGDSYKYKDSIIDLFDDVSHPILFSNPIEGLCFISKTSKKWNELSIYQFHPKDLNEAEVFCDNHVNILHYLSISLVDKSNIDLYQNYVDYCNGDFFDHHIEDYADYNANYNPLRWPGHVNYGHPPLGTVVSDEEFSEISDTHMNRGRYPHGKSSWDFPEKNIPKKNYVLQLIDSKNLYCDGINKQIDDLKIKLKLEQDRIDQFKKIEEILRRCENLGCSISVSTGYDQNIYSISIIFT